MTVEQEILAEVKELNEKLEPSTAFLMLRGAATGALVWGTALGVKHYLLPKQPRPKRSLSLRRS